MFEGGSRIIVRLSGTGSQGATIRIYLERYEGTNVSMATPEALAAFTDIAYKLTQLEKFTGRSTPSVIT